MSRETGDKDQLGWLSYLLGKLYTNQQEYVKASMVLEESVKISRELGVKTTLLWTLNELWMMKMHQGNSSVSQILLERYNWS